ncbi:MAG: ATP-dependent RecD-like DNA helicase [Candidatus Omnitrophota bacterium]
MMTTNETFDFNTEFAEAYSLMENSRRHIFVTGQAGTGKSTLLGYFRDHTTKNVVVLAPTGVAAVNVKGQTIHSFFHFRPDITPDSVRKIYLRKEARKLFANLETIIIDEISMVRADLLDCIDLFLRMHGPDGRKPFGGVQMIFIGDLFQLPPVVTRREEEIFRDHYESPYFFSARVMRELDLACIDLSRIYRQADDEFIALLQSVRTNTMQAEDLALLNERCAPGFAPDDEEFYIYLTTTNALADKMNARRLASVPGEPFLFQATREGAFEGRALPTQEHLKLKTGAQVMLLNNDPAGQWVNGSIGRITSVAEDLAETDIIRVELEDGREVEVGPFRWDMYKFYYDEVTKEVESESVGAFIQYPLKLAWAVTVHKSQGKTFQRVVLDVGRGAFAHGQTYVALSRCTHLNGLILRRPLNLRDIIVDPRIGKFMRGLEYQGKN